MLVWLTIITLRWRHNERDSVSNHQPHDCLLNLLFRRRLKKTSKLRVTGPCAWISPGTGKFPAQITSNAENVSIWWRHYELLAIPVFIFLVISGMLWDGPPRLIRLPPKSIWNFVVYSYPFLNFNDGLARSPMKLGCGWVITSNG